MPAARPAQSYTYSVELLQLGAMLLEHGVVVLNPHDLQLRSLGLADAQWLADLGTYCATLAWYEARLKTTTRIERHGGAGADAEPFRRWGHPGDADQP